ncbi:hypothetical protein LY76DRAFT_156460 [Colletotrichum caudatum]|nr:hypothetical protein LY76DRAFT_156460 [Colletotrichum caudatum]
MILLFFLFPLHFFLPNNFRAASPELGSHRLPHEILSLSLLPLPRFQLSRTQCEPVPTTDGWTWGALLGRGSRTARRFPSRSLGVSARLEMKALASKGRGGRLVRGLITGYLRHYPPPLRRLGERGGGGCHRCVLSRPAHFFDPRMCFPQLGHPLSMDGPRRSVEPQRHKGGKGGMRGSGASLSVSDLTDVKSHQKCAHARHTHTRHFLPPQKEQTRVDAAKADSHSQHRTGTGTGTGTKYRRDETQTQKPFISPPRPPPLLPGQQTKQKRTIAGLCAEGESNPRLPDAACGWQRRILPLNHRRGNEKAGWHPHAPFPLRSEVLLALVERVDVEKVPLPGLSICLGGGMDY